MHTHARMRETVKTRWEMQMFPNLMKCSAAAAAAHFNVYVSATTTVAKHLQKRGSCLALVWLFEAWKTFFPHYHNKQNIKGCPAIRELLFFTYYYSTHQRCLWVETRRQPVINNQTSHSTKFLTFENGQRGLLCVFWLLLNLFLFFFASLRAILM